MIVKGDVTIEALDEPQCEECDLPARQTLVLALRALGESIVIGKYCLACAEFQRNTLQEVLPDDDEEFRSGSLMSALVAASTAAGSLCARPRVYVRACQECGQEARITDACGKREPCSEQHAAGGCLSCGKIKGYFLHEPASRCGIFSGCVSTQGHKPRDHHEFVSARSAKAFSERTVRAAAAAIANARGGRRGAPPVSNILDMLEEMKRKSSVGSRLYDEVMEDARVALDAAAADIEAERAEAARSEL